MRTRNEILRILNSHINQFDICSLLKTLEGLNFPLSKILFKGGNTLTSQSALCKDIQVFSNEKAVLTLNLGLLMGSSPLPNYYRKSIDEGELDEEKFVSFLQFFNHFLIKNFIKMSVIEKFMFDDWKKMNFQHLNILGLNSVSSIHWLISLFFPDLTVRVSKSLKAKKFHVDDFKIGTSALGGKYALGGYIKNFSKAYTVTLKAETEQTDMHVFWPTEIRKRFREDIFPLIQKTSIYLIVHLTIDQYHRATQLSNYCHLGYTSLGDASKECKWLLFEG